MPHICLRCGPRGHSAQNPRFDSPWRPGRRHAQAIGPRQPLAREPLQVRRHKTQGNGWRWVPLEGPRAWGPLVKRPKMGVAQALAVSGPTRLGFGGAADHSRRRQDETLPGPVEQSPGRPPRGLTLRPGVDAQRKDRSWLQLGLTSTRSAKDSAEKHDSDLSHPPGGSATSRVPGRLSVRRHPSST